MAICRELMEELGLELAPGEIGPALWRRREQFSWNGVDYDQEETFFLVELARFDPVRCVDGATVDTTPVT